MFPEIEPLKKIDFNFHNLAEIFLLSAQKTFTQYPKNLQEFSSIRKKTLKNDPLDR